MSGREGSRAERNEAERVRFEAALDRFQIATGYRFVRTEWLREGLRHSSYVAEQLTGKAQSSNERLEFLGDAVLELVIREELFRQRPGDDEGEMSRVKACIAGARSLDQAARRIGIDKVLRVGRTHAGRELSRDMRADAVEAVIGAVYMDGGLGRAGEFVRNVLLPGGSIGGVAEGFDAKSRLKEWCEKRKLDPPRYACESAGPAHQPTFICTASAAGREGSGEAGSKVEAEGRAALAVLRAIGPSEDD